MAYRFARDDTPGGSDCFGRVFADVCAKKGVSFRMSDMGTDELEAFIEKKIMDAGGGGKKAVSTGQARSIAEQEIKTFIQIRMDLLERVDS